MKAAVIVFPGSNCDRDMAVGLKQAGADVTMVWHKDASLPDGIDVVAVPGGFSFGDYLRCGAIAARSPITSSLVRHVERGGYALGVCNGFQVLCETGILPGVLMRNAGLTYVCRPQPLTIETRSSAFLEGYGNTGQVTLPIAHHDGNYFADAAMLDELEAEDRVAFRYVGNPNGSQRDIAGILSPNRRVLGMMPHPERAMEAAHGSSDGAPLFAGLLGALTDA